MEDKRLSIRLDSCRQVLHAINSMLQRRQHNQRMLEQMNQLENLMISLDIRIMTEEDIERIEGSTNQLFAELTRLFSHHDMEKLNHLLH